MSGFGFRPLTASEAEEVASWRYDEPYPPYDHTDSGRLIGAEDYLGAYSEDGELVGFCCFGGPARVGGLAAEDGVLDVGGNLRPELTGLGLGAPFLRAVCALGAERFEPLEFRLAVAAFTAFLLTALGARRWWVIALFALTGSFGVFHVFYHWLKVPLPVGVLGL